MSRPSFIGMVGIGILGALVALQVSLRGSAQSAAWVDPARHTVRFVDLPGAGALCLPGEGRRDPPGDSLVGRGAADEPREEVT